MLPEPKSTWSTTHHIVDRNTHEAQLAHATPPPQIEGGCESSEVLRGFVVRILADPGPALTPNPQLMLAAHSDSRRGGPHRPGLGGHLSQESSGRLGAISICLKLEVQGAMNGSLPYQCSALRTSSRSPRGRALCVSLSDLMDASPYASLSYGRRT